MNPQDQNQPQIQQQPVPEPGQEAIADPAVDNKYIMETARQVLANEAANPGSQDRDALAWARSVVDNPSVPVPSTDVPQPPAVPTPQQLASTPSEQAASPDGHVLYIDRSQDQQPAPGESIQPTNGGDQGANQ